ncbi:MAG: hypothetical protein QE271_10305 [Bacteriovoracaceae bacterium]|nr:hypothetical protein [Bacteriovoracaceae bacterium]
MLRAAFQRLWLIFLFSTNDLSFASQLMGRDLLVYFQSTCKSQGDWTRRSLKDSEALISILESLRTDTDCVTASGAITQLGNLREKIGSLQETQRLNIEIEKVKAQEIEVQTQINSTTDPDSLLDLRSVLRSLQVQKAGLISQEQSRTRVLGGDLDSFLSNIIAGTNSVFETVTSNSKCLQKHSNLLTTATSLVGMIGGSLTAINPVLGIGLAAGTDFLGVVVEGTRKAKFNRKIRRIASSTLALEGYKCALESLSDRWCQLKDAESFLQFVAKLRRQNNEESGLKSVVRLSERDIPVILDWLNRVKTGVPATNSADAERRSLVYEREQIVKASDDQGTGILSENRSLYDTSTTNEDKWSVLKKVISNLAGVCSNSGLTRGSRNNPLFDIYPQSYSPYYLIGLDRIPTDNNNNPFDFCRFDPFSQLPGGAYSPNYDLAAQRYKDWVEKARSRVNQEMTLILQPDALQVLTSTYDRTTNKWKYSAIDSFKNVVNFLQKNRPQIFPHDAYQKIFDNTLKRLEDIVRIINESVNGPTNLALDPKSALEEIFKTADLQFGIIVIQARLEMVVRVSLDHYFSQIDPSEQDVAAQFLVADSFVSTLTKLSGSDDLALLSLDNRNAMSVSMNNLKNFGDIFQKELNRVIRKNADRAGNSDTSVGIVYERNVAEMCLLLSTLPEWPKKVNRKYCQNVQIPEVIPGGPSSVLVNDEYLKQNFSVRSCGYRDYIRKSKIYQDWGVRF